MFCKNCGGENSNAVKFCKHCGNQLLDLDNYTTKTSKTKQRKALSGGIVILAVAIVTRYVTSGLLNNSSNQDIVKKTVQQLKSGKTLPKKIDDVTTFTDAIEQPNAIRYIYSLHDADTSQMSNESLKKYIVPQLCQTSQIKNNVLDRGINLEYSYQVQDTSQDYFFVVTKADCK